METCITVMCIKAERQGGAKSSAPCARPSPKRPSRAFCIPTPTPASDPLTGPSLEDSRTSDVQNDSHCPASPPVFSSLSAS